MPSSAPRPLARRLGWLSVLATGATLFVSGVTGVASVEGTLQAAQVEQRQALQVQDGGWDCPGERERPVTGSPAEV
jgi:hypothetical protein